jgi:flagellar hook protein FlgE
VGYKTAEVRFADLVTQPRQGPGRAETLSGVRTQVFRFNDLDGLITNSTDNLDAALLGRGFFVTRTGATDGTFELTDAGDFDYTILRRGGAEETYITDIKGNFLMGWPADANGVVTPGTDLGGLQPIRIDPGAVQNAATPTTRMQITANLNNQTATGDSYTISTNIWDGTGSADNTADGRDISYVFTKTSNPNEWTMQVTAGANGTVTAPAAPVTVTFNANGTLASPTTQAVAVTWTSPAATSAINTTFLGLTQYDSPNVTQTLDYDGNPQGEFVDVTYNENGDVIARFSNETQRTIARIAAANVPNPFGLQAVSDTHYRITDLSGAAVLFDIASTDQFRLIPNALEQSATDIADEFGKLILAQSAYNSAATAVRTVDEMSQTAYRIKA